MPLFGANGQLQWNENRKRNSLNRIRLLNVKLNCSHSSTDRSTVDLVVNAKAESGSREEQQVFQRRIPSVMPASTPRM
jgi:hypothetical protein